MPQPRTADEFRQVAWPTIVELRNLVDATTRAGERHGEMPGPTSKAMAEIAEERKWATPNWTQPVGDTHDIGGLMLGATREHVLGFADLLKADHIPAYSHLAVARCAFEAAVVAGWLNDPTISVEERVKRGLAEQWHNQLEGKRLGLSANSAQKIATWRGTAAAHGWQASAKTYLVEGVARPKIGAGLAELLKQDIPAANLGHTQWCFLSAVSHSTLYGLLEAVLPPSAPDATGRSFATMYPKATTALTQAIVLMAALRCTAQRRFRLLGWDDDVWQAQCIATRNCEASLVNVALPQLFA